MSNHLCLRTECHREEGCYQWWGGQTRGRLQIIREHGWIQGLKDQWAIFVKTKEVGLERLDLSICVCWYPLYQPKISSFDRVNVCRLLQCFVPYRVGSPAATCARTCSQPPCHHMSLDPWAGSSISVPLRGRLPYCHVSLDLWVDSSISIPLWGGLLRHHVPLDPWSALYCHVTREPASLSPSSCEVGSPNATLSHGRGGPLL
jgi:hypothetical protein